EPHRETAERGGHDESGDRDAEGLSAIESIEEERAGDARDRRRGGVAPADDADSRRRNAQRSGEERSQRQHHHEVEDVDELDGAEYILRHDHESQRWELILFTREA